MGVALLAVTTGASLFLTMGTAHAFDVTTVNLGTASDFSVLAGTTVTNTGDSVLAGSVGVSPGTAITGFPPGIAVSEESNTQLAIDGQAALTSAYDDAAGRPVNLAVTADLSGLTLVGGVYAEGAKAALSLPGTLTLDGEGDPNSVFIFQTDSTLTTGSASTVLLINGAQPCNVFWQVGSSATLGSGSTFAGNILAFTSVTVDNGATVDGRALARGGAVTLDTNVFAEVGCDLTVATTTTTTTTEATTTTTAAATTTTAAATATTTTVAASTTTLAAAAAGTTTTIAAASDATASDATATDATTTTEAGQTTAVTTPTDTPTSLPFTGQNSIEILVVAMIALVLGVGFLRVGHGAGTKQD